MNQKAKNISNVSENHLKSRIAYMKSRSAEFTKEESQSKSLHVYISKGNTKTGDLVPSVSLMPIINCRNCSKCALKCYDFRNDCCYKNVMDTRANNSAIFNASPNKYFMEISGACKSFMSFRWHIGGDIINDTYFQGMIKVAKENRHCKFLAFTKAFDVVNRYLDSGKRIPKNLKIIFSGWKGLEMNNPYNLPTAHPMFADGFTTAPDGAKYCSGNCSVCLIKNKGCWNLKKGESVIFYAH